MRWLAALSFLCALGTNLPAQDEEPYEPTVLPASDEGRRNIAKFEVAPGLGVTLFAAEPMLANPVAFAVDNRGAFLVAETFRLHEGVTDNRRHTHREGWIDDELACRTVEDRVAMYEKHLDDFEFYSYEHERIRWIADHDGDGVADEARVFADGFSEAADGIAAGLLTEGGDVWYTCIPHLWRLNDDDRDGVADRRESLHGGYGVHTALLGHDMHGLCFGPDGKIYFSIGDRGLNVVNREGERLFLPDTGAVLRCNRDGSGLELFATGLRNPQELAFDNHGNLFTGDNNSDGGDKARWVYVAEGGDSGWRMSYQYLSDRGPWNREKLWHPHFPDQAAWILPPIANLGNGPSGLCYDTGTSLPERYRDHFFLCDFRGGSGNSGIHALQVTPRGAGFELTSTDKLIWRVLPTDVDFGIDGAMYLTDWTEGWDMTGKGRIYRIAPDEMPAAARTTEALLRAGMAGRSTEALVERLGHDDRRVRQLAQFALADTGGAAIAALGEVAAGPDQRLARIHALWALGQIAETDRRALAVVREQLQDGDGEIRAQAARVAGDRRDAEAAGALQKLLHDRSSRVRYFSALALGKLAHGSALANVVSMVEHNADRDPFLRHAGVMAMHGMGKVGALIDLASHESPAVRRAALLALRRHGSREVARFLDDEDPSLVREAASAIHDVPILDAFPALATLVDRPGLTDEPTLRRALSAAFHLGGPERARSVARLAARSESPLAMRIEALAELADWPTPSGRDRVLGLWRPIEPRSSAEATTAMLPLLDDLIYQAEGDVAVAAIRAVGSLRIQEAGSRLAQLVFDGARTPPERAAALAALEHLQHADLATVARRACEDESSDLRREGLRILATLEPDAVLPVIETVLDVAPIDEQRHVIGVLGGMQHESVDDILAGWLDRLLRDDVPMEVRLDLLEAAGQRDNEALTAQIDRYQASKPQDDPLSPFVEATVGGDRGRGADIYWGNAAADCRRCHAIQESGGEAGPALDGVGKRLDRRALLESLVVPGAKIAPGFGTVVLTMKDGTVHAGVLREETEDRLVIVAADLSETTVDPAQVQERTTPISAMPPMSGMLSTRELRDLVEYLASLQEEPAPRGH